MTAHTTEPGFGSNGDERDAALLPVSGSSGAVDLRWAMLYEAHRPGLLRWLQGRLRDAGDAEDCCQEAFLRLLRELRDGRVPDVPMAWLRRVAGNLVVSRARHAEVVARVARRPGPIPDGDPVLSEIVERERIADLSAGFARLSVAERELILRAANGSSTDRLADTLGISPGAARTRLHRARRHLVAASGGSWRHPAPEAEADPLPPGRSLVSP